MAKANLKYRKHRSLERASQELSRNILLLVAVKFRKLTYRITQQIKLGGSIN